MTRYVIGADVAFRLAAEAAAVSGEHQLVAPTRCASWCPSRRTTR